MTKHHYGLPTKEQINLPKNVTHPPGKLTHVSLKTDYFNMDYIHLPTIENLRKQKIVFFFRGPKNTFRAFSGLKKTVGNHRGSRKGPPPVPLNGPPTSRLDQTTSWRWTSGDFHHGPINP